MYHHYTTQGLVLNVYRRRESAVGVVLLTREFGLLTAGAQGVRLMKSKLRYCLSQYSCIKVVLVRGQGGWRITSAEFENNLFAGLRGRSQARVVMARILTLTGRLMDEGVGYSQVFDLVLEGVGLVPEFSADSLKLEALERLIVLRLMYMLGYMDQRSPWGVFLRDQSWSPELLNHMSKLVRPTTQAINRSLIASGL